jgi:hypothetical protein
MERQVRPATIFTKLLVAAVMVTGGVVAVATQATAAVSPMAAQPITATGHATAHSTTVSAAMAMSQTSTPTRSAGTLGRDGRSTGDGLAVTPAATARPTPSKPPLRAGDPNVGSGTTSSVTSARPRAVGTSAASPSSVNPAVSPAIGTQGVTQGNSGCASCATPDVTAAVNSTEMAETANLRLQVFNKSGTSLCNVSLPTLVGATSPLSGPRIQYDSTNKRFSMVIDTVPATSDDVAVQYLATSQSDDACGAWWIYTTIFQLSTTYPFGALLDFPYLGQDSTSILLSTNNYSFSGSYLGSSAYAEPKSILYTGGPFNFNIYSVGFSTAAVTVAGIPVASTTNTYWLAAVPGSGYKLYVMPTNPAGAISLQANVSAPFSAPSRRIRQPGTTQTLDPLDGRLGSAAVQAGKVIWFAHTIDDGGFPTVQYGGLDVTTGQIDTGLAFHDTASDDFNASIGVSPVTSTTDDIWVNWAYTDVPAGIAASDAVAGVAPGQGVPDLAGVDLTLVNGSAATSTTKFGRYSSVSIDPAATASCPAGRTALSAQEYFTGNQWTTQLARTTFC